MGSSSQEFSVRFWGVRGSISCPGPETVRYGGNTSCLEMRCDGRTLIFDGGTGLRPLGAHLDARGPVEADLFFTHTHFDHICGLPFFSSAYRQDQQVPPVGRAICCPTTRCATCCRDMMMAPLFPMPIERASAPTSRSTTSARGETLSPGAGTTITHRAAQPPQRRHRLPRRVCRQVDLLRHRHRARARAARPGDPRPDRRRRPRDLRFDLHRRRIRRPCRLGPLDLAGRHPPRRRGAGEAARAVPSRPRPRRRLHGPDRRPWPTRCAPAPWSRAKA